MNILTLVQSWLPSHVQWLPVSWGGGGRGRGGGCGVGREEDWDSPRSHRFLLSPIVLVLAEKSSLLAFFWEGGMTIDQEQCLFVRDHERKPFGKTLVYALFPWAFDYAKYAFK